MISEKMVQEMPKISNKETQFNSKENLPTKNSRISIENNDLALRDLSVAERAIEVREDAESIDLDHLRKLLGRDPVFLPIPKGQKGPTIKGWNKFTAEDSRKGEREGAFQSCNIGVLLGEASEGLCAIDIDVDEQVEPFLALNPALTKTLHTKGKRGAQIWVRIEGEYPKLGKITDGDGNEWGEWRATGGQSVIYGRHPSGCQYQIAHEASPVEIGFADINWPPGLILPWNDKADQPAGDEVGPPYKLLDNGSIQLNNFFWVRKYKAEQTIVFDSALGEFFEYESASGLWRKLTVEAIKRGFIEELGTLAKQPGLESLFFRINDTLATNLVALLRTLIERHDVFAKRPEAIHVKNGMLVFEKAELSLKTFSPEYYSRNACPYEFDESAECPRFINELLLPALDEDDIELMQRWAGACLLGKNLAQRFLLMMGTPNGGKSTFMNILEAVIGIQNVTQLRTENLTNRFELYGFVGKTLLTGKDVPADFLLNKNAHVIKALVGSDLLSAEKKGQADPVPLRGDFNLGVTCNADLNVRLEGDMGAYRRRMMVVRYEKEAVKQRIADFAERLLAEEGAGILRWMVEGAQKYLKDIAEKGDFVLSDAQRKRVDDLLAQSDSVRHFVQSRVVKSPVNSVACRDLQSSYLQYCEERGWVPLPARDVSTQLPAAMLEKHQIRLRHDLGDNKSIRGYNGVRLIQEEGGDEEN